MKFPPLAKKIVAPSWGASHQDTEGRRLQTRDTVSQNALRPGKGLILLNAALLGPALLILPEQCIPRLEAAGTSFSFFFFKQSLLPLPSFIQHAINKYPRQT